jgi:hypothetical protein
MHGHMNVKLIKYCFSQLRLSVRGQHFITGFYIACANHVFMCDLCVTIEYIILCLNIKTFLIISSITPAVHLLLSGVDKASADSIAQRPPCVMRAPKT